MKITSESRGIPHIEDLSPQDFVKFVQNIHEAEATEKLDGSQILFGIDETGFYTSRETKGVISRTYTESSYGMRFAEVYMRSAHKLLEKALPDLVAAGLKVGDQVEAEVLYGSLPNVVPYSEDTNYLIFLRTTQGDVDITRLANQLEGKDYPVSLLVPATIDGRTIVKGIEINNWKIARSPIINIPNLQRKVEKSLDDLREYYLEDSGMAALPNGVVSSFSLSKKPPAMTPDLWKHIKEHRDSIREEIQKKMLVTKKILLEHVIHKQASKFGPTLDNGGWIEGIVLKDAESGTLIKLVDKDKFGVKRIAAWEHRNKLAGKSRSIKGSSTFIGNLYLRLAITLGHPELGTTGGKKYYIETDISSTVIKLNTVKDYWKTCIKEHRQGLERDLQEYMMNFTGDENIMQRTLQVFAECFQRLDDLSNKSRIAKNIEDLAEALIV